MRMAKPFPWPVNGERGERFTVTGGCWCPGAATLNQVRIMGHTKLCAEARQASRASSERLSALDEQRRADEQAGRQLREAAIDVLTASPASTSSGVTGQGGKGSSGADRVGRSVGDA